VIRYILSLALFDLKNYTVTDLLNERAGGGEIVSGTPLVLTAVTGSHRNLALFVDRSRPTPASVTINVCANQRRSRR
jgi:hypothetical protein